MLLKYQVLFINNDQVYPGLLDLELVSFLHKRAVFSVRDALFTQVSMLSSHMLIKFLTHPPPSYQPSPASLEKCQPDFNSDFQIKTFLRNSHSLHIENWDGITGKAKKYFLKKSLLDFTKISTCHDHSCPKEPFFKPLTSLVVYGL